MDDFIKKELLKSMDQIAVEMPNIIYNQHFDEYGADMKYPLAIFVDAFKSINVFCYSLQCVALTQAGTILRMLLEQVSIVWILAEHPEFLPKYVEHYKLRKEIHNKCKRDQIDIISEKYGIDNTPHALTYLDYGWIKYPEDMRSGEDAMIIYAGFSDINTWRKKFLDKLTHTAYTTTDLIGETGDFPIITDFIKIAAKLFDHLCVAFHKMTDFDFIIDGKDLFNGEFRKISIFLNELE